MVTHPPYSRLPRYMLLDLPQDVIRSAPRFRLRVHTLRVQTATWNSISSPTCDLCDADDDVQDEKHVFHCTRPQMVSLRRKCEHNNITDRTGSVSFFTPRINKLLVLLCEQVSSHTS